jgi:hypothetical protein
MTGVPDFRDGSDAWLGYQTAGRALTALRLRGKLWIRIFIEPLTRKTDLLSLNIQSLFASLEAGKVSLNVVPLLPDTPELRQVMPPPCF